MAGLTAVDDAGPPATAIAGGSVPGGKDHPVAATVVEAAGKDALGVKYVPYDGDRKAMTALRLCRPDFPKRLIRHMRVKRKSSA